MRRSILLLGNFLSATRQHRHYCEDLAERLEADGWRVTRASSKIGRISRLAEMAQVTWRYRHDYQIAHIDLFSGLAFTWAEVVGFELERLGKPFVVTMHGGELPSFARRWPRRARRMLSRAAIVTSPSPYLARAMRAYAPSIVVIPNGLDVDRYPFSVRERPLGRIIWVRAFHRIYNPLMAVEMLAELRARHPDATLRMIGPDRDGSLGDVRRRAAELGVDGQLEIVGPLPNAQIPSELARADIFLNTSSADNTPVSVLEAMAAGLCIVSSDVGGIPDLVQHERTGLLVSAGDSRQAARAVARVIDEPELARELSANARDVVRNFGWPTVVKRWNRVLEGAATHA
jgi:glycosyltransferase involved in cell wall biosynthesis